MSVPRKPYPVQTSFIVVNWNRRNLLEQCLRSLEQQTVGDFELILVDNGSTDGSLDCLKECSLPSVKVVRNPENVGFARAVNQGLQNAQGQFIALVNNDVHLDPHWLEEIQGGFAGDARVGMCAGKILLAHDPRRIDKVGQVFYPDGQIYGRGHREEDRGQYDQVEEALWPDGAAAIYRREVFAEIGCFDEDFFAYCDDGEFGLRARLFGWNCLYIPTARAFHHHSATWGEYAARKIFLVERNRIWLAIKLLPGRQLALLPFYSAVRYLYSVLALASRQGDMGRASRQGPIGTVIFAVLRAQASAAGGLVRMWRKRKEIRPRRRISDAELARLLQRHSISAFELVFSG